MEEPGMMTDFDQIQKKLCCMGGFIWKILIYVVDKHCKEAAGLKKWSLNILGHSSDLRTLLT